MERNKEVKLEGEEEGDMEEPEPLQQLQPIVPSTLAPPPFRPLFPPLPFTTPAHRIILPT